MISGGVCLRDTSLAQPELCWCVGTHLCLPLGEYSRHAGRGCARTQLSITEDVYSKAERRYWLPETSSVCCSTNHKAAKVILLQGTGLENRDFGRLRPCANFSFHALPTTLPPRVGNEFESAVRHPEPRTEPYLTGNGTWHEIRGKERPTAALRCKTPETATAVPYSVLKSLVRYNPFTGHLVIKNQQTRIINLSIRLPQMPRYMLFSANRVLRSCS